MNLNSKSHIQLTQHNFLTQEHFSKTYKSSLVKAREEETAFSHV